MPTQNDSLALDIDTPPRNALAIQTPTQDPVARAIAEMMTKGITTENVAALDKLSDLYLKLQANDAEKQFVAAFNALQSEMPVIVASTVIPNRGKYERFEDVMRIVSPLLAKHGFSVSFSMDFMENRILETCYLKHVGGHSQANSFAVRAGGKADSDTQADCKAATTAKRNALLNCLNIVIRQDVMIDEEHDAAIEGGPISRDQVQVLNELLKETGSDTAKFLAMAGVEKVEEIRTGNYGVLFRALNMKGRK